MSGPIPDRARFLERQDTPSPIITKITPITLTQSERVLLRRLIHHTLADCKLPLYEHEYKTLSNILDKLYEGGSIWGR
jgi:hypothetical protein